jgi:hypothetical protein
MPAAFDATNRQPRRPYGDELALSFGAEAPAPAIVTRSMPNAERTLAELRVSADAKAPRIHIVKLGQGPS